MFAEMEMCGLDPCQSVTGNWLMLGVGSVIIYLLWRYAP